MNKEIERIIKKNKHKSRFYSNYKQPKKKKKNHNKENNSNEINRLNVILNRVLISAMVFMVLLISSKDPKINFIYKATFDNFNFAKVDQVFSDYYGRIFPKPDDEDLYVNNTYVTLNNTNTYQDGVMVETSLYSPVESHVDGIVIQIYEDDDLGKVLVIQDQYGLEYHYGNLENIRVNLYSRIEYGEILGVGKATENLDKSLFYLSIKDGDNTLDVVTVINDES